MKQLFALLLLTVTAPTVLAAQDTPCMPTAEAEASLIDWYGERPVSGSQEEGAVLWTAGYGQSWTLLSYQADGMSCTLAQGDDWVPSLDIPLDPDLLIASSDG